MHYKKQYGSTTGWEAEVTLEVSQIVPNPLDIIRKINRFSLSTQ